MTSQVDTIHYGNETSRSAIPGLPASMTPKGWASGEIWRTYILLTRVEAASLAMNSPLAERPIFHHLERRTQTHIFLCIPPYHLLAAIEKRFLDRGLHTSWWTVHPRLRTHPFPWAGSRRVRDGSCQCVRRAGSRSARPRNAKMLRSLIPVSVILLLLPAVSGSAQASPPLSFVQQVGALQRELG